MVSPIVTGLLQAILILLSTAQVPDSSSADCFLQEKKNRDAVIKTKRDLSWYMDQGFKVLQISVIKGNKETCLRLWLNVCRLVLAYKGAQSFVGQCKCFHFFNDWFTGAAVSVLIYY